MELKATKYKNRLSKIRWFRWENILQSHGRVKKTVILRGVMQHPEMVKLISKWEPSFLLPTPFSFLMLKAFVQCLFDIHWRLVKFSAFAVLSKWSCPLIKFCSARNHFFYCCSLCPHKCKNKCYALKKLWSEISQIWTYTMYDLTAFC